MTTIKKHDVVISKKEGEEWFCLEFPEEYRFYNIDRPWDPQVFRNKGLALVSIKVRATKATGEKNETIYNRHNPLNLECGVESFNGRYSTTPQNIMASFHLRVDDVIELNTAIKEISKKFEFEIWEVQQLVLYNTSLGATIEYKLHNPDSTGTKLYFFRVMTGEFESTYENVSLYEQQRLSNNFYDKIAACRLVTRSVPECAIRHRKKRGRKPIPNRVA